jgi:cytoskeleton protein RodZ
MSQTLPSSPEPPPDPSADGGRQGVGRLLRRTREGKNIEVAAAAARLRIRPAYLEAIEAGDYARLPGIVYALGFVRAYAEHLGLDGEEAVRRFKLEGQGRDGQRGLAFPAPLAERSIPGGRILVAALVLGVCGYGFWYYQTRNAHQRPEMVAAVPASLALPENEPPDGDASATVPANAAPQPAAAMTSSPPAPTGNAIPAQSVAVANPAPPSPAPPAASVPASIATAPAAPAPQPPSPAPPQQTAALPPPTPAPAQPPADTGAPAASSAGTIYGAAGGSVRIVLKVNADSWIQIKDATQEIVFGKLLHAGDSYRVPDQAGMTLRVGNSDGLAIAVDGTPVPLPGGSSKVRNVVLDPVRLLAGTAQLPLSPSANSAAATPSGDAAGQ